MHNDYVILIDSFGQPYIAHSIGSRFKSAAGKVKSGVKSAGEGMGRGWRASTKYLLKVGEGAKAQYAYTQAEVDRLMGRGRQAAGAAAEKVKQTATNAAQKGRDALSTAGSKAKDYSARASSAISRHGSETLKSVKDYASRAVDKAKDIAGVDERERRDKAWDNLGSRIDTSSEKSRDAWKDFEKARSEYLKTPLGKIEYTKERAKEILTGQDGTPKEIAEDLGRKAGAKIKETAEKAKEKASEIKDKAENAMTNVSEKIRDKVEDVAGVDERERLDEARKARDKMYDRGLELAAEREPLRQAYIDFNNEMFEKYGVNYDQKMTNSEKSKYEKLESDLTEISEQWWDATIRQMYPAAYGSDPTLTDKLKEAEAEFRATPLGKLEEFRKHRK